MLLAVCSLQGRDFCGPCSSVRPAVACVAAAVCAAQRRAEAAACGGSSVRAQRTRLLLLLLELAEHLDGLLAEVGVEEERAHQCKHAAALLQGGAHDMCEYV